jgi:hypothetical protein
MIASQSRVNKDQDADLRLYRTVTTARYPLIVLESFLPRTARVTTPPVHFGFHGERGFFLGQLSTKKRRAQRDVIQFINSRHKRGLCEVRVISLFL